MRRIEEMSADPSLVTAPSTASGPPTATEPPAVTGPARRSEMLIVAALATFAAIRVLVFCAAFPVNNNMDEGNHFDVAIFYSRGVVPRALGPHAKELRRWTDNWSPEFLVTPDVYLQPQQIVRPSLEAQIKANLELAKIEHNHEMLEPPLYYSLAGAWLALGELIRVPDADMFYWVRFLNALVLPATVWLGYVSRAGSVSRQPVPENRHARAVGHHPTGRAVRHQRRRALTVVVWARLPGARPLDESKASRD